MRWYRLATLQAYTCLQALQASACWQCACSGALCVDCVVTDLWQVMFFFVCSRTNQVKLPWNHKSEQTVLTITSMNRRCCPRLMDSQHTGDVERPAPEAQRSVSLRSPRSESYPRTDKRTISVTAPEPAYRSIHARKLRIVGCRSPSRAVSQLAT